MKPPASPETATPYQLPPLPVSACRPEIQPALLHYIRMLADNLGLRDWTIILGDEPPGEGLMADVGPILGRKHAVLRLAPQFYTCTKDRQRQTLVHELVELQFAPARLYANGVLPGDTLWVLNINLEYGIDGIADAMAPLMPLPGW